MSERPKANSDVFYTSLDDMVSGMKDLSGMNPRVNTVLKKIVTAIPAELNTDPVATLSAFGVLCAFVIDHLPEGADRDGVRQSLCDMIHVRAEP